jgi:hypothetical protein
MKLLIMLLSSSSYYFLSVRFKYSLQHLLLKHSKSLLFVHGKNQLSHPYKTTYTTIILYTRMGTQLFTSLEMLSFFSNSSVCLFYTVTNLNTK